MSAEPRLPDPVAAKRWTAGAKGGLALILVVAAALLIGRGLHQFVGYDSLWTVFIARQNTWAGFWGEVKNNAHPPLYYLLLKASLWLPGTPPLAYRVISIAAMLVSTLLVARIVRRITGNQPLAVAGAAAFGLSFNTIDIGLETRPYSLCVTCMLVAFSAYLDWLGSRAAFVPARKRVMFAGALTAALLNHYATFFFLAAALSAPLVLACFHIRWRVRLAREMRRPLLPALMFGIPVAVGTLEYVFHVRRAIALNNHVADSLYHHGRESIAAFVARTTSDLAQLFSPALGWNSTVAAAVMVGLFAALGVLAARRTFRGRLITVPFVFVVVMWLLNVVAALMGVYPYPGELRHQFHLFAFTLLALFAAIECARRTLPSSWHSDHVWTTIAGMAATANFALWLSMSTVTPTRLMQPQMEEFRKIISSPPAVLVDQFNLIALFGHHDTADWSLVQQDRKSHPWQVWSVTQPGQRFAVCRSMQWQLDLSSPETYAEAAHCLELTRAERVALFRPQQSFAEPSWDIKATSSLAAELAPRVGLFTEKVVVEGDDVYASFRFPPGEGESR